MSKRGFKSTHKENYHIELCLLTVIGKLNAGDINASFARVHEVGVTPKSDAITQLETMKLF